MSLLSYTYDGLSRLLTVRNYGGAGNMTYRYNVSIFDIRAKYGEKQGHPLIIEWVV